MYTNNTNKRRCGFSLIELVIVVVIIGIIGAIAIPRLSRGAEGAADSALAGDLAVLRNAIDLYATEHGGAFPDESDFADQLTLYTDDEGSTSNTKTGDFIYGPYIRSIPELKVSEQKGNSGVAASDGTGVGWIYNENTGVISANSGSAADASGTAYSAY